MLARAIREGIGHDGRVLDPYMPYEWYHVLSDEDLASIIVYLRSLPAVFEGYSTGRCLAALPRRLRSMGRTV